MFKKYTARPLRAALLALIALLLVAVPVLAVIYRAPLAITETGSVAYTMLPIMVDNDNQWMADNGFMKATALDTRVETLGGTEKPHMVVDDRILTATTIPADSQTNLYFTTGDSDLSSLDIIAGANGHLETEDAAALELANNFELEYDGYVDINDIATPLVYKPGAYLLEVSAAGTLTAGMINADSYDVTPVAFAAWTDVDVSDYVPDTASGVVVEIDTADNWKETGLRKNGSSDNLVYDSEHYWAMVGVDEDGVFEVYLEDNTVHLYIRAYTDECWEYNTDADDISMTDLAAWTDVDISTYAPSDATGAIIQIVNTDAGNPRTTGVRKNGSADDRHDNLLQENHTWRIVGLDDNQILEGYIATADVDFYLIGWVTGGATFATNGTDKSLGGAGVWTNVDCSTEAPNAEYLIFEFGIATDDGIGLRENGSTDNVITDITSSQAQGIVKCDMNQVCENYEEDIANTEVFLIGYTTCGIYPPHPNPTYNLSVSVAGVAAGEHNIVVTSTGGGTNLLAIDVDSGAHTNNVALAANTVTDTTNNWRFMSYGSPYIDHYYHTVAAALQLTYEPVTMILGDTIVDETNAFDGTLIWGCNPVGVDVSLSSLVAASQPSVGADTDDPTRDILPEAPSSDWFVEPDVTGALLTNPLRPLVTIMSESTTLTERQAWTWLGVAFVLLVLGGTARAVRGHHIITGVATGGAIGALVAQTIFPLWTVVFIVIAILVGAVSERSPSL